MKIIQYTFSLKVGTEDKTTWAKVKAKTVDYFKTISIPGISRIMTTESYLFKFIWTVMIVAVFVCGFQNISMAISEYYKHDKITNIERITLENMTFPAITICQRGSYKRDFYSNNTFVRTENILIKTDNVSRIRNFISDSFFYSKVSGELFIVSNDLEYFKIPEDYDCVRFNGFSKNKSVQFFEANTTSDIFGVKINNLYNESISQNQYYVYSFTPRYSAHPEYFDVFITDNYLKSFHNVEPMKLSFKNYHDIEIEKESIEIELTEPYNHCKESPIDEPYHQWNCIESCIYREIENVYNCSFLRSLFAIPGLKQCNNSADNMILKFKKEFLVGCKKECPDSCYSEKFVHYLTTSKKDGYTRLEFSFRDFSSLNITQIPKTDLFTFINNIGGGLGLFMGIALPNLIEFMQFIFEIFLVIIS